FSVDGREGSDLLRVSAYDRKAVVGLEPTPDLGRVQAGLPNPVVEFAAGLGGLTLLLLAAAVGLLRDGAVVVIVRDEAGHAAEEVAASVGYAGADLLRGVAGDRE